MANLLLVRAESRHTELAIRAALGAGAGRIAREMLVESVTLGIFGGIAGLGLAYGALRAIVALAPGNLPRIEEIGIDGPVLLFTSVLAVFAGLLFGAMRAGSGLMQIQAGIPVQMVNVLQAVILFFLTAELIVRYLFRVRAESAEISELKTITSSYGTGQAVK